MKRIFKEKTLSILLRSILLGYPIISSSSFAVPLRAETDEFNANWGLSRIGAQYAYEKGYTGKGIAIGVADSDFPSGISELTDKLTFVTPNKDGKEHNSDLSIGSKVADGFNAEDYTHGAHVSGIIGAKKNDQGMHGVAYGADIFAQHMNNNIYPFLDTTAVRLINNSWGTEGDKDYGINPGDPQWKDLIGIDGISTSTVKDFEKKSDKTKPYDFLNRVIYTTTPTKRGESKISITVKDVVEAEDGIIERNGQKFNFGANDKSNNGLVNQIRALREAGKQGVVNIFAAGNYNHYNEPGAFQGMPIVYNDLLPNYLTVSNLTLVRSKEITVPEDSETLSAGDDLQFFEVTFQNKKYLRQANLAIGKEDYLWEQVGQGLRQTQILVNDDSTKETLYTGSSQCGYTALWCVAAPGTGIYSSTFKVEDGKLADNYEYMTGTSMAAPHATGALAVLMERFPYMSSSQTVSVLKTTAADMDENGRVTDGRAKVIDKYFGWGKIDLENAIKGPAMFASADDVKNMLAEDVKQNLGDDLDNLANTFGNGDFTVNMGQGIKYDIGTTRERSCDAAECSFDTWSNNIAGSGGLIKKGSGTLQLSGNNTYAGNTFINEGGIDITGSLSSGIIVNKLGTLSGQGQSATIEINSGRFAPSLYNQTGFSTFTINGDIKFSPDATYSAKIRDKNEQVDKLVVRGNAYLNGANFQTYEQSPDKLLGKNDTLRYQGNEYTLMDATKINGIFNNNYLTSIATENIQPELTKTEEDKKLKLQFRDLTADKAAAEKAAADKAAAEKAAAEKAAAEKAAAEKAATDKTAAEKAAADKAAAEKAAADKAAAEKAAADKAAADKAAAEKAAAEKAAADKAATDQAAAEKAAADKAAADQAAAEKAAADKAAADQAAADKAAAEKAAADKAADQAAAEKAAAEKAAADKAAADQAAAEKAAAEKAAADKAAAEKAAADKAAVEKAAAEKAAADKAAAEKAASDKAAAEKAIADQAATEKAAAEKAAAEKAAADKAAAEKAAADKAAAEKAANDKAAADQAAAEKAAAEKSAADKAAADKAAAEKAAAEKAAAEKAAADQAAAEKAAAEKAAADKAAAEKAAADKASADQAAAEKAAAEKAAADQAAAEKAAAEKAAAEKAAADKAAADKAAVEKAAVEKAAAEKAAADKAAVEKAAAEKAVADQAATEKAANDKAAAEKAAADQAAAEKATADKAASEKAAAEKAAAEKAAADKAAAEKAAAEKAAAEKAAAEKAAADKAAAEKTAADKAAAEKVAADKAAADKAAAEAKLLEQARAEKATQIASIHGDILAEEFQDMDRNRRLTNQRLRYIQRNQENSNNAWIDFSDSKSKSRLGEWNNLSNAKMHDYNVQRQGLALGADTTLGDWAIGITAAINSKDLNNKNNANAKIDNYQFGIYTGTQIDQINFRFSGTLGRNEVKSRFNDQNDGQFNAKYNGRTYQLNAEMGYALQRNNLYMEPFIGVAYDYLENDSIQQSNGYYSLNSEKTNIDRVSSTVGLDISQKWNVWDTTSLSLNASLAWQNRLKNNDKAGKLTFISNNSLIAGDAGYLDVPNNQNTGIINFGFNVDIANTHGFSVNYEGQFAKKYSENGIRLQYGYKF
ncbi:histone H1-like repetitive region-containing protein [Acinetobacter sp. I-MWF]|uniref:histone H1-like repetitive region-containing protein n=1 Tax=Acinetobacter sp. I-MWF TaxID=2940517 RepID=UPI0021C63B29|nr:histone H1-like repetitive region-containing protein [Acinetobacter sp. I-MWF]MCT9979568.1 histone H1-like repetitive region-containing protein [Acinetobacter sp. I-MWF]